MLISIPSTHPTVNPAYPPRLIRIPVPEGVIPIRRPSTGKSLPIAVGGSVTEISGMELITAATKVFEFGPGQTR
jgi:hypothetical protein